MGIGMTTSNLIFEMLCVNSVMCRLFYHNCHMLLLHWHSVCLKHADLRVAVNSFHRI